MKVINNLRVSASRCSLTAGVTPRAPGRDPYLTARFPRGRLAERVRDPYVILALMGHASVKTSMIYIHQSGASVAERLSGVEW